MSFFVDIVTEDSFYENLTLGVTRLLEGMPCVKNVRIERRNGCEAGAITTWEQRHCCILPEDVRNFYASVDGFLLLWNLEIAGESFPVGRMEIGPLSCLRRYSGVPRDERGSSSGEGEAEGASGRCGSPESGCPAAAGSSRGCKMFEIAQGFPSSGRAGRVYLVYRLKPEQEQPSVWLHAEEPDRWYRLADSFTVYFRTMLVHLGLPLWQCCAAGLPLPTWVEQVYYLVGPHLLQSALQPAESISASLWNNGPPNVLDPGIFKGKEAKQRNARKK